jgi:Skp family chaperone for outer membrane proteins
MKSLSLAAILALFSLSSTFVLAAEDTPQLTGCAAKQQAVQTQIDQAKANGNGDQQAGLEKALSEIKANCTDAGLKKERENKVLDAKREVSKRQADLEKAMKKTDSDKINSRKDKLAEARKALQEAVDDLDK